MDDIVIQAIGVVAMVLLVAAVQLASRGRILAVRTVAHVLWIVHFLLLGAATGAVMNFIGAVRTYVFQRWGSGENRSIGIFWSMTFLTGVAGLLTWHGWLSILPIIGTSFAAVATWQRNEQKIRWILLLACPLWFAYSALTGSYAGMLTEIITVMSLCTGLWRYRKRTLTFKV